MDERRFPCVECRKPDAVIEHGMCAACDYDLRAMLQEASGKPIPELGQWQYNTYKDAVLPEAEKETT